MRLHALLVVVGSKMFIYAAVQEQELCRSKNFVSHISLLYANTTLVSEVGAPNRREVVPPQLYLAVGTQAAASLAFVAQWVGEKGWRR